MIGAYKKRDLLSSAVIAMVHLSGQDTPALLEVWLLDLSHQETTWFIMDGWLSRTLQNFL